MGHFIVDDLGPGYNTKADSMLRMKRMGGAGTPKFILTDETIPAGAEPRAELARMMTSHPQFARSTVNMFWPKLIVFGILHPVDALHLTPHDPHNLPQP